MDDVLNESRMNKKLKGNREYKKVDGVKRKKKEGECSLIKILIKN